MKKRREDDGDTVADAKDLDAVGEELELDEDDEEILNAVWAKIAAETKANPDKYKEHDERVRQWSAQRKAAADAPPESSED